MLVEKIGRCVGVGRWRRILGQAQNIPAQPLELGGDVVDPLAIRASASSLSPFIGFACDRFKLATERKSLVPSFGAAQPAIAIQVGRPLLAELDIGGANGPRR
jgi:hypothetical protein